VELVQGLVALLVSVAQLLALVLAQRVLETQPLVLAVQELKLE